MSEKLLDFEKLNIAFEGSDAQAVLKWALKTFNGKVAFANSFGAEDAALTHMLVNIDPTTRIFTLDTGRLSNETYELWAKLEETYGIRIEPYFPDAKAVEEMVRQHGINLFYRSVDLRKLCCRVRKIEPLRRALSGADAWITGLRREQSMTRARLLKVEEDKANGGTVKVNPLADWTEKDVWDYIRENRIPYNQLHDLNYPSIGCAPCTRAVAPGEDLRAGRWWWEKPETKECGLHRKNSSSI
ncbi:MAG: phosphoadenylyl-sulfate reductase [Spirochaetota bacterium]